ncbi:MAG: hypothetical protein HC834_07055 [Rhodospirillales bacterium]|nr:hypothetical protein [Rhodospirillales bacterium]
MSSANAIDVLLAPSHVGKELVQYKDLKRVAKRANRDNGEPKQNFSIVWLPGGRPAFRFFNKAAADSFKAAAPAGSLS